MQNLPLYKHYGKSRLIPIQVTLQAFYQQTYIYTMSSKRFQNVTVICWLLTCVSTVSHSNKNRQISLLMSSIADSTVSFFLWCPIYCQLWKLYAFCKFFGLSLRYTWLIWLMACVRGRAKSATLRDRSTPASEGIRVLMWQQILTNNGNPSSIAISSTQRAWQYLLFNQP